MESAIIQSEGESEMREMRVRTIKWAWESSSDDSRARDKRADGHVYFHKHQQFLALYFATGSFTNYVLCTVQ